MDSAKYHRVSDCSTDDHGEAQYSDLLRKDSTFNKRRGVHGVRKAAQAQQWLNKVSGWTLPKTALMILLIINIFVFPLWLVILQRSSFRDPSLTTYSPANRVVEYETRVQTEDLLENWSGYSGWPNDESDRLWRKLHENGMRMAIQDVDMHGVRNATERVAKGKFKGQKMVGLAMSHQLHCLNGLRMSLYPERYPEMAVWGRNGSLNAEIWTHHDHCIDILRQALMCHGDVSLFVMRWNNYGHFLRPRYDTEKTCRKFDKIDQWAGKHTIDTWYRGDRLVLPDDVVVEEDFHTEFEDRSGGDKTVATWFRELLTV